MTDDEVLKRALAFGHRLCVAKRLGWRRGWAWEGRKIPKKHWRTREQAIAWMRQALEDGTAPFLSW